MRIRFFGDSYDIVKQSLIHWMESGGAWAVAARRMLALFSLDSMGFASRPFM